LRDSLDRRTGAVYDPKKFWENHADRYVRERVSLGRAVEGTEIDALVNAVATLSPATALEVGCAYGRLVRIFAERSNVPWIVGSDLSGKMLRHARENLATLQVPLVQADAVHLPFADRSFDVVYTYGLMMHVAPLHVARVVGELARVASIGVACLETAPPTEKSLVSRQSYAHDYRTLFTEAGWATTGEWHIGRRICFVCRPKGTGV
jgi:ubiquinone/menaquinone biosynthesis C-methylase UbiE